ncbi:hypothetical protein KTH_37670 [Thermosporothrix hazakensis]|uniref:Uncharacterized protein n=1 Tax=Thermosporothrix sp. COM3 TaxID=2490863 RepID=A0A455SR01_9CHLR|nr:hypothetical protein KTC_55980 [Thermosporothrix sp. COM3]GCE48898.1 hypothetical protein KTH_37670 [Thermosporothrix hazakensis]
MASGAASVKELRDLFCYATLSEKCLFVLLDDMLYEAVHRTLLEGEKNACQMQRNPDGGKRYRGFWLSGGIESTRMWLSSGVCCESLTSRQFL